MDRIEMFREALADQPDDRFASYGLALELKKSGRHAEAEQAFLALLQAHPTSGAGYYQLGQLLESLGRDDEARTVWERGLTALAGLDTADARRSISDLQGALDAL